MKKYLVLLFLLSLPAHANKYDAYRFGRTIVAMKYLGRFLVNRSCNPPDFCEAYRKGKEFENVQIDPELSPGGANPFSAKCKHYMGGEVLVGKDLKGNEAAFCRFKDGSYLR